MNPPFRAAIIYVSGDEGNFNFDIVNEIGNETGGGVIEPPEAFFVSLKWASPSVNLDLHVKEPQNTHVYKNNLNGNFGKLLGDVLAGGDRSEVYQSLASEEIVGDYLIGVNYFSGQGPQNATIQFIVGTNNFETNIQLLAPIGKAGDSVVPYVAGILRISLDDGDLVGEFIPDQPPCPNSIEVYAAWDQYLDIDLHIYEPGQSNLYVMHPNGIVGSLTRSYWGF